MMHSPEDQLFDGAETYNEKNDDYGDSWRQVGAFLAELAGDDGITLESEEDFISFGLFTRRLDKIARAFNGEFNADSLNFESVVDAHQDEMVYAAMHATNEHDRVREGTVDHTGGHVTVVPHDE
jgi:hypothetical protein